MRPGTTIALPPVCSMVNVYSTMLPHRSDTVRFVVLWPFSASRNEKRPARSIVKYLASLPFCAPNPAEKRLPS